MEPLAVIKGIPNGGHGDYGPPAARRDGQVVRALLVFEVVEQRTEEYGGHGEEEHKHTHLACAPSHRESEHLRRIHFMYSATTIIQCTVLYIHEQITK